MYAVDENIIVPPTQVQIPGTSENSIHAAKAASGNFINSRGCRLVISVSEYALVIHMCAKVPNRAIAQR